MHLWGVWGGGGLDRVVGFIGEAVGSGAGDCDGGGSVRVAGYCVSGVLEWSGASALGRRLAGFDREGVLRMCGALLW